MQGSLCVKLNQQMVIEFSRTKTVASVFAACCVLTALTYSPPIQAQTPEATPGKRSLSVVDTHIVVKRFDVQGNSSLSQTQIDTVLKPFLGGVDNLAALQSAAVALQTAYYKAGHLITQVVLPTQEINDGSVILKVIEGRISDVVVSGNQRLNRDTIVNSLPLLQPGQTIDLHDLNAALQLANENPSRRLAVNFRPDKNVGDIIANVRVQEADAQKYTVSLNDTGNDSTGNYRLSLAWQNTNVLQKDHVATLQYTLAPDDLSAVSIIGGGYRIPFYRQGLLLDLVAAYSNVSSGNVPTPSGTLDFSGKGLVLGGQLTRLLPSVLKLQHRATASLYQRQYRNDCNLNNNPGGCGGAGVDYTTQPLAIGYSGKWSEPGRQINFNLSGSINLPGGPNGGKTDFAAARAGADNRYLIWRMGADLNQQLPNDWSLRGAIEGQQASEPLVSGEQFGLGGADSIRGFGERALTGDRGWRGTLELYAPDLGGKTSVAGLALRPLIFLESGRLTRLNPQVGDRPNESVTSAGLGVRIGYDGKLSAQLDWGRLLDGGGNINDGDSRFHFSLGYVF
jgi:hemolysin activation/secretion protein